jgi:four helix bundle protein
MASTGSGFDHERLEVYQRALDLVVLADELATRFTGVRRHLGWQLHRAASSVVLNIAEGNGRVGPRDKAQFFVIATGSALECAAVLDIAERLGLGSPLNHEEMRDLIRHIVRMLSGLSRSVRARPT